MREWNIVPFASKSMANRDTAACFRSKGANCLLTSDHQPFYGGSGPQIRSMTVLDFQSVKRLLTSSAQLLDIHIHQTITACAPCYPIGNERKAVVDSSNNQVAIASTQMPDVTKPNARTDSLLLLTYTDGCIFSTTSNTQNPQLQ